MITIFVVRNRPKPTANAALASIQAIAWQAKLANADHLRQFVTFWKEYI
jgi:hypothetical protein